MRRQTKALRRGLLLTGLGLILFGSAATCEALPSELPPLPSPSVEVHGQRVETITEAIALARDGETIALRSGVYREHVDVIRPVTLKAAGDGPVWIDGECDRLHGIHILADGVTVRGIGVRQAREATIRLDGADNVVLEGVSVQDWNCTGEEDQFRAGLASWDGGRKLIVRDSTFERRVDLDGPDAGYGNAIWVKNSSAFDGGGHIIQRNTIIGGFDGIGGEPEDVSWGGVRGNTLIENNTISDCSDDGIQVEGGTAHVMVRGNTIRGCLVGIALAPALRGPLTITRNVILDPVAHRGEGPAMLKVGDGSVGQVYVLHNSFFAGEVEADGVKQTNAGVSNIHFRNNAIYAGRYVFEMGEDVNMDFDYDAIVTSDRGRFAVWGGHRVDDFGQFQQATRQELNGVTTRDFEWDERLRLLPGSPLIDRGVVIPGVNDDYTGHAPDIGAFEFPSPVWMNNDLTIIP